MGPHLQHLGPRLSSLARAISRLTAILVACEAESVAAVVGSERPRVADPGVGATGEIKAAGVGGLDDRAVG